MVARLLFVILVSFLLVGCATKGDLQELKEFVIAEDNGIEGRVEREFCVNLYDDVTNCDDKPKGCFIDGMITDSGDDDGCVSPGTRYCVTPGLVYMPNTGDKDNCQSPRSYCEGNPDDPNC
jgi:hypothetical protein